MLLCAIARLAIEPASSISARAYFFKVGLTEMLRLAELSQSLANQHDGAACEREQLPALGTPCTGTKRDLFSSGLNLASRQCSRMFCVRIVDGRKRILGSTDVQRRITPRALASHQPCWPAATPHIFVPLRGRGARVFSHSSLPVARSLPIGNARSDPERENGVTRCTTNVVLYFGDLVSFSGICLISGA